MYEVRMYGLWAGLLDGILLLFRGYCLTFYYGSFLRPRGGGKGRRRFVWLGLLFVAASLLLDRAAELFWPSAEPFDVAASLARRAALYGLLFLAALLLCEARRGLLLFLSVTYAAVSEIGLFLAYSVSWLGGTVFDLLGGLYERGRFSSAESFVAAIETAACLLQLVTNLVMMAVLYAVLAFVVRTYRHRDYPLHRTELAFLLLPAATGLLFCELLRGIMVTMEGSRPSFLYDRYPFLSVAVPALLILCMLSIAYGVKLFQNMISLYEERRRLSILEKQVAGMEEHIGEIERVYSGVRAMKHDMKNQLAVLGELVRRESRARESGELQGYLAELESSLDGLDFPRRTGSAAVDTLLAMKFHEARLRAPGIRLDADGLLAPEGLRIRAMDLSVILGNGLDNALEACEALKAARPDAEPFIRAASARRGNFFLIEIENSFDGELLWEEGDELPRTRKADRAIHGIGLHSIRATAEKYRGGMDWSAENGVFSLTVLLKNESQ